MQRSNKILIDTNILVYMYKNKKDIFDFAEVVIPDAEFFVLDKTYEELGKVFSKKPQKLGLIKKYLQKLEDINKIKKIIVPKEIYEKKTTVDKLLIYYSYEYLIYTNDKGLTRKLKDKRRKVLTLKEKGVFLN